MKTAHRLRFDPLENTSSKKNQKNLKTLVPYNSITLNMFTACVVRVGINCTTGEFVNLLSCELIQFNSWVILSVKVRVIGTKLWQRGCELSDESALPQLTSSLGGVESCCGHQRIIDMKWWTRHWRTRLLAALGRINLDFCLVCDVHECLHGSTVLFYAVQMELLCGWGWSEPSGVSLTSFRLICWWRGAVLSPALKIQHNINKATSERSCYRIREDFFFYSPLWPEAAQLRYLA